MGAIQDQFTALGATLEAVLAAEAERLDAVGTRVAQQEIAIGALRERVIEHDNDEERHSGAPSDGGGAETSRLMISTTPHRVSALPLSSAMALSGDVYVFWEGPAAKVTFYLDGNLTKAEQVSPFDMMGTRPDGTANPLDTTAFANGAHVIRADSGADVVERIVTFENAVVEPEPPEPPPSGNYPPRQTVAKRVFRGQADIIIADFTTDAAGGWGLELIDCQRVKVINFGVDRGGVKIENCEDVEFIDGYAQWNTPGNPSWSDDEVCFRVRRSKNIKFLRCVGAYGDCIWRGEAFEGLFIIDCFSFNPRGPFPRGQHFQSWEFEGKRSKNLQIINHYGLTDFFHPGPTGASKMWQEDANNISAVDGVLVSDTHMEMRGAHLGSPSGTGTITEQACTDVRVIRSVFKGQANHGISVSGRSVAYMEEVIAFYDGQGVRNGNIKNIGGGATAVVCRQNSTLEFGPGCQFYGTKQDGSWGANWFEPGGSTVINRDAPKYGHFRDGLALFDSLVRTAIPDVGFALPAGA